MLVISHRGSGISALKVADLAPHNWLRVLLGRRIHHSFNIFGFQVLEKGTWKNSTEIRQQYSFLSRILLPSTRRLRRTKGKGYGAVLKIASPHLDMVNLVALQRVCLTSIVTHRSSEKPIVCTQDAYLPLMECIFMDRSVWSPFTETCPRKLVTGRHGFVKAQHVIRTQPYQPIKRQYWMRLHTDTPDSKTVTVYGRWLRLQFATIVLYQSWLFLVGVLYVVLKAPFFLLSNLQVKVTI